MADSDPEVLDAMAIGIPDRASIADRVKQRLTVIRQWHEDGVPLGVTLPRSLTAVRLWEDEALGIQKISSPNEFTREHAIVGESVREIDSKLAALRIRYQDTRTTKQSRAVPKEPKSDAKYYENQLTQAVSQWHSQRAERLTAERRAAAAEARCLLLQKDLDDRERQIAHLTSIVAASGKLRSVK